MKTKIMATTALAVLFAFGIGGGLQHVFANQTPKDDSAQGQSNSGMMGGGGMMGQGSGQKQGMMGGGMMGMMGQMGEHHQQMTSLMNKLMASMAAIQSEKDPEALKSKLAEHQKLLEQMHGQMMQQGNRMKMMSGQMRQQCPGAGDSSMSPTK